MAPPLLVLQNRVVPVSLLREEILEKLSISRESSSEEVDRKPVSIFKGVTLPDRVVGVLPRSLRYPSVLRGSGAYSWEELKSLLLRTDTDIKSKRAGGLPREMFAVSWSPELSVMIESDNSYLKASKLIEESGEGKLTNEKLLQMLKSCESYQENEHAFIELDNKFCAEEQFEKLTEKVKKVIIHRIEVHNVGYMWVRTYGAGIKTISKLFRNPINYEEDKWIDETINLYSQYLPVNVVCVSGIAGSGKTTLLTNVCHALTEKVSHRLVCFVNLKRFSQLMTQLRKPANFRLNFDIFFQLMCSYFNVTAAVEKQVFRCMLSPSKSGTGKKNDWKAELLLDGLDKMQKGMQKALLTFLKDELGPSTTWSFRVWITTRPHLKAEVEETFSVIAFDLELLKRDDVLSYMEVNGLAEESDTVLGENFQNELKLDVAGLLAVPPRMMAFQTFLTKRKAANVDIQSLKSLAILSELVKNVKDNYTPVQMAPKSKQEGKDAILWNHVALACQMILQENYTNCGKSADHFGESNYIEKFTRESFLVEQKLLEFGLAMKTEGEINLIHPAYAHYILADYYTHKKATANVLKDFFFRYLLFIDECEPVRNLYSQQLYEGVNTILVKWWYGEIENFLIDTYQLSREDGLESAHATGNVLQLAIVDQQLTIAKLFLRSFAPSKRLELKRLIQRKVKVEVSFGQPKREESETSEENPVGNFIELCSLSLALLFGDLELIHMMYSVLHEGNGVFDDSHMTCFSTWDAHKFHPVHLAVLGSNLDALKYLTKRMKMSINQLDLNGHVPLHLAFYNGWTLKFWVAQPPHRGPTSSSAPLTQQRLIKREVQIVKLYNGYIPAKAVDRAGNHPAMAFQQESYVQMKMEKNPSFFHKERSNPGKNIYYKNISNYLAIVEYLTGRTLLNSRKSVSANAAIEPPFHLACAGGYFPIVECMAGKILNIGITDQHGYNALLPAFRGRNWDIVKFLLAKGIKKCELTIQKIISDEALMKPVVVGSSPATLEFILEELAIPVDLKLGDQTLLHIVCQKETKSCLEKANMLINLGANVDAGNGGGFTPLLNACRASGKRSQEESVGLIDLLIGKGADVNAATDTGRTPLHFLAESGSARLVRHFMECGGGTEKINVGATTFEDGIQGQTPLHLACKKRGNLEVIQILVDKYGADVNQVANLSRTPRTNSSDQNAVESLGTELPFLTLN